MSSLFYRLALRPGVADVPFYSGTQLRLAVRYSVQRLSQIVTGTERNGAEKRAKPGGVGVKVLSKSPTGRDIHGDGGGGGGGWGGGGLG